MSNSKQKSKRVCVTMTEQDHEYLTQLAYKTLRTRSGYYEVAFASRFPGKRHL